MLTVNYPTELVEFYKNKKIIVLGGSGFIGSNLSLALQKICAKLIIVDGFIKGTGGNKCNLIDVDANLIQANINDVYSWKDEIEPNSIIFHCAAKNTHKWCNLNVEEDYNINYKPQFAIIQEIRKINLNIKLIYCSTRTVYKNTLNSPITEFSPISPQDTYSIHSFASEQLFRLLLPDQQVRILRLTNTFGPRQRLSGDELGLVGEIIHAALNDDFYQVFQNGTAKRDVNYIDDVVRALLYIAMVEKIPHPIIHLGGSWIQTKDIVELLSAITGWKKYEYLNLPSKSVAPLSIARAMKLLKWSPDVDLKSGLTATVNFFQQNKEKYGISK